MSSEGTKQPWEARVREVAKTAEEDVQRLIAYINDEVMPDIRRNSSSALKAASAELQKLAQRMDDVHKKP